LKYWLPSVRYTRPSRTARNSPTGQARQRRQLRARPRDIEAARHQRDHVRVGLAQRLPRHPRRVLPGRPKRLTPPARVTSSGTQLPAAINGASHSTQATRGRLARPRPSRDGVDAPLEARDQIAPAVQHAQGQGDALDVLPQVGQGVGVKRDDGGAALQPRADGALHVALADGADLALRLRDDHVRLQPRQQLAVNVVDRQRLAQPVLDLAVDLLAGQVNVERRAVQTGRRLTAAGSRTRATGRRGGPPSRWRKRSQWRWRSSTRRAAHAGLPSCPPRGPPILPGRARPPRKSRAAAHLHGVKG